jgi:hypothetical protein
LVDSLSANGACSSDEKLEFRGDFDACSFLFDVRTAGRFGGREGGSESAADTGASSSRCRGSSGTRLGRIRPFEADATATGDGSAFCAPDVAAATGGDSRLSPARGGLLSRDSASGLNVVARLDRRRTSTVNEGNARLNVVLATAHRSADSSPRGRPCEARPNNARGDHLGNKLATSAAPSFGGPGAIRR